MLSLNEVATSKAQKFVAVSTQRFNSLRITDQKLHVDVHRSVRGTRAEHVQITVCIPLDATVVKVGCNFRDRSSYATGATRFALRVAAPVAHMAGAISVVNALTAMKHTSHSGCVRTTTIPRTPVIAVDPCCGLSTMSTLFGAVLC